MGEGPVLFCRMPIVSLSTIRIFAVIFAIWSVAGCGVLNVGKWKGVERTDSDEKFYLLKTCPIGLIVVGPSQESLRPYPG